MKKSILFSLIILSNIIIIKSQILKIPFKTKEKKNLSSDNIISKLIENDIYIEIKIGTPTQNIPLYLKLNQFPTFITSSNYSKNISKFDYSKSITFELKQTEDSNFFDFDCLKGKLSEDILYFNDVNNNSIKVNNFSFILASELKKGKEDISGEIGLKINSYIYINENVIFIDSLKKKNISQTYSFSIKYDKDNNNKGEFIFGNYYHYYNEKYKESDFYFMKVGIPRSKIEWQLFFNNVYINNSLLKGNEVDLSYEFGLILGTYHYYNIIYQSYFNNYKNDCVEKIFNYNNEEYFYIECNNTINVLKFPFLIFNNYDINFNFTFNGEELFYKSNDKLYFLIVFKTNHSFRWKFGKIFFQKYHIFFDKEKKIIGLYPYIIDNDNNKNKNNKFNFRFSLPWFLVIILFLILIGTIFYIKMYLTYKKRKLRANELEDEFEYSIQNNNYEKKDNLFSF